MTPEEIQAFITEAIAAAKTELLTTVDQKNQGLGAALTREIKKLQQSTSQPETPTEGDQQSEGRLTLKALQDQIAQLNKSLADKDAAAVRSAKQAAIAKLVSSKSLTQPEAAMKLFAGDFGDSIREEGGAFFIEKDGAVLPLDKGFDDFVNANTWLIPASGVDGSGSREKRKPATPAANGAIESPWLALAEET